MPFKMHHFILNGRQFPCSKPNNAPTRTFIGHVASQLPVGPIVISPDRLIDCVHTQIQTHTHRLPVGWAEEAHLGSLCALIGTQCASQRRLYTSAHRSALFIVMYYFFRWSWIPEKGASFRDARPTKAGAQAMRCIYNLKRRFFFVRPSIAVRHGSDDVHWRVPWLASRSVHNEPRHLPMEMYWK